MKTILAVLALIITTTAPCAAQLGASYDQCFKDYGAPTWSEQETGRALFERNGIRMQVTMLEKRVVAVDYSRSFSEDKPLEWIKLMKQSGSGWIEYKKTSDERTFRDDAENFARYDEQQQRLWLFSKGHMSAIEKEREKQQGIRDALHRLK